MYYKNSLFDWLPEIEAHWSDIRDEVLALTGEADFLPWPERDYYNFGWKIYSLYGWGIRFDKHCENCPQTTQLIERIPGLVNAGFSKMSPWTHIKAHKNNKPEGLLRLHVPLIIPDGCVFRVTNSERKWIAGDCFVFDDCLEHEAWNQSNEDRIVLLADFPADDLVHYKPQGRYVKRALDRLFGNQTTFNYLQPGMQFEDAFSDI